QRVGVVEPLAAELLRLVQPQEAEIAELLEQLMGREDVGLLPLVDVRIDLGRDESLQAAADFVVIGGEEHLAFLSFRGGREAGEPGISIRFGNIWIPGSRFARPGMTARVPSA